MRFVTQYEDSELPGIAIAPPSFDIPLAEMWVRSHQEPMMMRDRDGHFVLICLGPNNSVQIESPAFWRITDVHAAASKMRKWLDANGLLTPEDPAN
jgi:hypothetical protein